MTQTSRDFKKSNARCRVLWLLIVTDPERRRVLGRDPGRGHDHDLDKGKAVNCVVRWGVM